LSFSSGRTVERAEVEADRTATGGFSITFYGINSN